MTKVTGELISIDDSAYDGFKGMTIYGKTVQNLWVNPSGTINGVTVTANDNGSVTLSGTSTESLWMGYNPNYALRPGGVYTLSLDRNVTSSETYFCVESRDSARVVTQLARANKVGSIVFTVPSSSAYCNFLFSVKGANTTVSGTYRVMLREATPEEIAKAASTPQTLPVYPDGNGPDASDAELGIMPLDEVSTLADFDDYWCPPGLSSIDEVEVVTTGKNLVSLDKESTNNGIIFTPTADGGIHVHGVKTGQGLTVCFLDIAGVDQGENWGRVAKIIPDGVYTMCGATSEVYLYSTTYVNYNDGDNIGIKSYAVKPDVEFVSIDVNDPVWSLNVRLVTKSAVDSFDCVVYPQFELGSTATDYEPPNITTTPIDLQSNSLRSLPDGTRDELHIDRDGNCTLVKRVDVVEVGTEAFWAQYLDTNAYKADKLPYAHAKTSDIIGAYDDGIMCDKFVCLPVNWNGNSITSVALSDNAAYSKTVFFAPPSGKKPNEFSFTLLYPLATPQTIQLGKISLPKLRKKPLVNNIWANGWASGTGFQLAPEIDYEYNRWRMGCDGISADGQHSFWDLGGCIAARDTGVPEKKPVTATVPYMSGFYDLSDLYGAVAYDSREVMYRFEFVEDSREDLQDIKSRFLKWLANVQNAEIVDDDIPGRHLIGSFSEAEFEEGEEGESGSLEVTFLCQPFFEADEETTKTLSAGANTVTIEGQAVNAYAKSVGTSTLQIGGVNQSVGTTEIRLSQQLKPGDNAVTVTGSAVTLRWRENTI